MYIGSLIYLYKDKENILNKQILISYNTVQMGYKDNLNKKLIVIVYHLTTEQFEDMFEDITEDDQIRILNEIYNKRFE